MTEPTAMQLRGGAPLITDALTRPVDSMTDHQAQVGWSVVRYITDQLGERINEYKANLIQRALASGETEESGSKIIRTASGYIRAKIRNVAEFDVPKLTEALVKAGIPLKDAGTVTLDVDPTKLAALAKQYGIPIEEFGTQVLKPDKKKVEKLVLSSRLPVDILAATCTVATSYTFDTDVGDEAFEKVKLLTTLEEIDERP